jgi:hypothetical protein
MYIHQVMNITRLLLIALSISFVASACAPVTAEQLAQARAKMGNPSNLPKVSVDEVSIAGVWTAACVLDSSKMYRKDVVSFSTGYSTFTSTFFSDASCALALYSQESSGYDQLAGDTIIVNFANVAILPETAIMVSSFNLNGFCNAHDWQVGTMKFINDPTICKLPESLTKKITRNGDNYLVLGTQTFLKN